jgi:hypothetical protein
VKRGNFYVAILKHASHAVTSNPMDTRSSESTNAPSIYKWEPDTYFYSGPSAGAGTFAMSEGFFPLNEHLCPFCGFLLSDRKTTKVTDSDTGGRPTSEQTAFLMFCSKCGWYRAIGSRYSRIVHLDYEWFGRQTVLRKFSVDDRAKVSLEKLGTYLRVKFSDAYAMPWRALEEYITHRLAECARTAG